MYATLLPQIKATLQEVTEVQDVFSTPKTKLDKYPAVFFKPAGLGNEAESTEENYKVYRFDLIVIIGTNATTKEHVFGTVLPAVVDAIIAKFDTDWNMGTIDGHRVWSTLTSAEPWDISEEQDGLEAFAPLTLEVRLLTTN